MDVLWVGRPAPSGIARRLPATTARVVRRICRNILTHRKKSFRCIAARLGRAWIAQQIFEDVHRVGTLPVDCAWRRRNTMASAVRSLIFQDRPTQQKQVGPLCAGPVGGVELCEGVGAPISQASACSQVPSIRCFVNVALGQRRVIHFE